MKQSNNKTIRIIMAGEGGQGIQTIAKAIAEAAVESGYMTSYIPAFGVEQRGTPSVSFVIISDSAIHYPRFEVCDYAIILRTRAIHRVEQYITPHTITLFDSSTVDYAKLPKLALRKLSLPATQIATEKYHPKSFNMIILGVLSKLLEIEQNITWNSAVYNLGDKFKDPEIEKLNHDAFDYGFHATLENNHFKKPIYETKTSPNIFRNSEKIAEIDPSLCKGCGICIEKCPVKALSFSADMGVFALPVPKIDLEKCIICGSCRRFCPDGAIGVNKTAK